MLLNEATSAGILPAIERLANKVESLASAYEHYIIAVIIFSYASVAMMSGLYRADSYMLGSRDTAIYQHALWQAGRFMHPETDVIPGMHTYPLTATHFMPTAFIFGLFYAAFPYVHTTLVLYALIFSISALLLYKVFRKIGIGVLFSVLLLLSYLFVYTPVVQHFYFEDWAVLFISAALYCTVKKEYYWALLYWVLAMGCKEYIGLAVSGFACGIWYYNYKGSTPNRTLTPYDSTRNRYALGLAGFGVLWFILAFFVAMKSFAPVWANQEMFKEALDSDGFSASSVIATMFTRFFDFLTLRYAMDMVLPLAGLSLISWAYMASILPILLLNILPDGGHAIRYGGLNQHYTIMIQPFIVFAGAFGWVWLRDSMRSRTGRVLRLVRIGLVLVIAVNIVVGIRFHLYKLEESIHIAHATGHHSVDVNKAFSKIPAHSSVAAEEQLLPFLANRKLLIHLDNINTVPPDYMVTDVFYDAWAHNQNYDSLGYYKQYQALSVTHEPVPIKGYALLHVIGSIAIYKRQNRPDLALHYLQ